jgi:hypothetical protein
VLMNMGGSGDKRFFLEARLAKAYLAAGRGDFPTAREIIGADRPQFETNLSGSWIELFQGLSNRSYRVPPGGSPGRPNDRRPGDRNPEPGNPPQGGEN